MERISGMAGKDLKSPDMYNRLTNSPLHSELYGNEQRNSLHLLNEYFTKYPKDGE
jgi:hypothetical protein